MFQTIAVISSTIEEFHNLSQGTGEETDREARAGGVRFT
jgi:hypothetical protein